MNKFNKWVAKHLTLCVVISVIVALAAFLLLRRFGVHPLIALVAYFAVILVSVIAINAIVILPFVKLSALLNDSGDPSELIKVCEFLQSCLISKQTKSVISINHACALRNIGRYYQSYEILRSVDQSHISKPPTNKVVYYNNLADICYLIGEVEEASEFHEKAKQSYNSLPDKAKASLPDNFFASLDAQKEFSRGNYQTVLDILTLADEKKLVHKTDNAVLRAKAHIALGNTDEAKRELNFVIENGNKLYAVTEAKKLLSEIENK